MNKDHDVGEEILLQTGLLDKQERGLLQDFLLFFLSNKCSLVLLCVIVYSYDDCNQASKSSKSSENNNVQAMNV
jgi:hypothetical protein